MIVIDGSLAAQLLQGCRPLQPSWTHVRSHHPLAYSLAGRTVCCVHSHQAGVLARRENNPPRAQPPPLAYLHAGRTIHYVHSHPTGVFARRENSPPRTGTNPPRAVRRAIARKGPRRIGACAWLQLQQQRSQESIKKQEIHKTQGIHKKQGIHEKQGSYEKQEFL